MKERLRRWLWAYIRLVQQVLLVVLLTAAYFLVLGPTYLLALLFRPRLLRPTPARPEESCWVQAEGYATDLEHSTRQS